MELQFIPEQSHECGYYQNRTARFEQFLSSDYTAEELHFMLDMGFRHFGPYFFRPQCTDCKACIPLRIKLVPEALTSNRRRKLNKQSDLSFSITDTPLTETHFQLYQEHKERFPLDRESDSFDSFAASFQKDQKTANRLDIHLHGRLVCSCHFDDAKNVLSAVYTYYSQKHKSRGLGTLAVLWLINYGLQQGRRYLYLGYYLHNHPHMAYKSRYTPNEALVTDHQWINFFSGNRDAENQSLCSTIINNGFTTGEDLKSLLVNS